MLHASPGNDGEREKVKEEDQGDYNALVGFGILVALFTALAIKVTAMVKETCEKRSRGEHASVRAMRGHNKMPAGDEEEDIGINYKEKIHYYRRWRRDQPPADDQGRQLVQIEEEVHNERWDIPDEELFFNKKDRIAHHTREDWKPVLTTDYGVRYHYSLNCPTLAAKRRWDAFDRQRLLAALQCLKRAVDQPWAASLWLWRMDGFGWAPLHAPIPVVPEWLITFMIAAFLVEVWPWTFVVDSLQPWAHGHAMALAPPWPPALGAPLTGATASAPSGGVALRRSAFRARPEELNLSLSLGLCLGASRGFRRGSSLPRRAVAPGATASPANVEPDTSADDLGSERLRRRAARWWRKLRGAQAEGRGRAGKALRRARAKSKDLWAEAKRRLQRLEGPRRLRMAGSSLRTAWKRVSLPQQVLTLVLALLLLVATCRLPRTHPALQVGAERALQAPLLQLLPEEEARLQVLQETSKGVFYVRGQPAPWLSEKESQGAFVPGGTCWLFDDTHVVTSLSNIDLARRGSLRLLLPDRSELPLRVLGVDEGSDLAVLELTPKAAARVKATPLALGSSASLRLGQEVLVLGREATLDMRVSRGVVYGQGQPLVLKKDHPIQSCIQTDAVMTSSNRGGPLLNSRGQVIGMAVAQTEDPRIGQSIPSDSLRKHVSSILASGRVSRPALGMFLAPDGFAEKLGVAKGGVVVEEVLPGSPAKKAGLRAGDIIISRGDLVIRRMDDLITALEPIQSGDHFSLTVLRQTAGEGKLFAPFSSSTYSQIDLTVAAFNSVVA
ncbi:unnamed protein product [Effrenium voratum]|uniref:PDZ domain-containing protein n=1 Tax=Effrenium voratum TaxID=2562239 RepID=A0AA36IUA0_9DINO|nr:unnamed protein product [Effrenium voratum]